MLQPSWVWVAVFLGSLFLVKQLFPSSTAKQTTKVMDRSSTSDRGKSDPPTKKKKKKSKKKKSAASTPVPAPVGPGYFASSMHPSGIAQARNG